MYSFTMGEARGAGGARGGVHWNCPPDLLCFLRGPWHLECLGAGHRRVDDEQEISRRCIVSFILLVRPLVRRLACAHHATQLGVLRLVHESPGVWLGTTLDWFRLLASGTLRCPPPSVG